MSDEPPPHFDEQDRSLADPIFDELNEAGIDLSGDGTFEGELSRNVFLACPNFRILLHGQTEGPHPEVLLNLWAGTYESPTIGPCKAIVEELPFGSKSSCLFLGRSWKTDFFDRLSETTQLAAEIEESRRADTVSEELVELLTNLWHVFEDHQRTNAQRLALLSQPYDEQKLQAELKGQELLDRMEKLSEDVTSAFDSR